MIRSELQPLPIVSESLASSPLLPGAQPAASREVGVAPELLLFKLSYHKMDIW